MTHTETERVVERFSQFIDARRHDDNLSDEDDENLCAIAALLTRQQEEIGARDAEIARLREAAKGSLAIVNIAKKELRHVRSVLRNQTCLFGSVMRTFSPDPQEEYRGLTDFEIAVSPAVRAALQAKPDGKEE